jgi:hypothetical protein
VAGGDDSTVLVTETNQAMDRSARPPATRLTTARVKLGIGRVLPLDQFGPALLLLAISGVRDSRPRAGSDVQQAGELRTSRPPFAGSSAINLMLASGSDLGYLA